MADRVIELGHQIAAGNFLDAKMTRRMWQYVMEEAAILTEDTVERGWRRWRTLRMWRIFGRRRIGATLVGGCWTTGQA